MNSLDQHPLFKPAVLGSHVLRGRLVLPPMASGTADADGQVTAATLAHYDRIVGDRHALAWVEYTGVHAWGRSEPNQTMLSSERHLPGLTDLARLIRAKGALPGIQLTHAGAKTDVDLIGRRPLGASALPVPAHGGDMPAPEPMTAVEIAELFDAFVTAARRAEACGFAAIEIHAAHGYFFNQWLSPLTNQRKDAHGGSPENRRQLLVTLVAELRRVLKPSTLLSVRFPGQDRLPGGMEPEEAAELGRALKAAGMDMLDVSSGLGGWRRGRDQRGEGYLVSDAAFLRREVGLPVIGVGGVSSLEYASEALQEVDFVAVGRAVLENPAWPLAA
ncbi:MAG: namA [Cyanobacteria bacterium RYN_339]|nr:namA [Cyanobacteria bacterium RYN_339]